MQPRSYAVNLDGLLAQLEEQIALAAGAVNIQALVTLVHLQGQRAGVLRAAQWSREQHVGPAVPMPRMAPEVEEPSMNGGG